MDDLAWLEEQLLTLAKTSKEYETRALYLGVLSLLQEQEKRKSQLEGRLDGELWSRRDWGSKS